MNLFNLVARLSLDNSDYNDRVDESEKKASTFGQKVASGIKVAAKGFTALVSGIGIATGAMAKLVSSAVQYGKDIEIQAQQTQMSTDAFQKWGLVLQMNGLETDKLRDATKELNNKIAEAKTGSADALLALESLGIGYEDLANMSPEEIFNKVVNSLQNMEEGTEKTAAAQKIFGEVATELAPVFNMTTEELDKQFQSFEELGLIMSEDMINASKEVSNNWTIMTTRVKNLAYSVGGEFLPEVLNLIEAIMDLASGTEGAMDRVTDSILNFIDKATDVLFGFLDKLIDSAPEILETIIDLVLNIFDKLLEVVPELVPKLIELIQDLLLKVIEILPELTQEIFEIALTLVDTLLDALLKVDWVTLIIELLNVLIEIVLGQLPAFVSDIAIELIDTLMSLFLTGEGWKKLGTLGLGIAEAIINALLTGFESGLNTIIKYANNVIDGLSKLWEWTGIAGIPNIPSVSIPKVDFYAEGGIFDKYTKGTMYAIAGEAGAEIVAEGPAGTGVANVKQIADAQSLGIKNSGLNETIERAVVAIVNGIVYGLKDGTMTKEQIINLSLQLGDSNVKNYIFKVVDDRLKALGLKSLKQMGAQ